MLEKMEEVFGKRLRGTRRGEKERKDCTKVSEHTAS